jgi:hypothetical protein
MPLAAFVVGASKRNSQCAKHGAAAGSAATNARKKIQ